MVKLSRRVVAAEQQPFTPTAMSFTFGGSRQHKHWSDRRSLSWPDLLKLLRAPELGPKDGICYTPAVFSGDQRSKDHADRIDVAVLDCDCGPDLMDILQRLRELQWRATVHSTHSHLTTQTVIAATPFDEWQQANPNDSVGAYLIRKKG